MDTRTKLAAAYAITVALCLITLAGIFIWLHEKPVHDDISETEALLEITRVQTEIVYFEFYSTNNSPLTKT